ncbi:hypothetical protein CVT24_000465 [Panaeolus cyanescens]|uniref:Uncharacterized protein n=1 Tax=Panaeolus cyanescens TaxID=181874 RepID=A0A409V8C7_9AGAR|nr:hypothetical protein CVT24_000465 [Panaeolus cyanescens]
METLPPSVYPRISAHFQPITPSFQASPFLNIQLPAVNYPPPNQWLSTNLVSPQGPRDPYELSKAELTQRVSKWLSGIEFATLQNPGPRTRKSRTYKPYYRPVVSSRASSDSSSRRLSSDPKQNTLSALHGDQRKVRGCHDRDPQPLIPPLPTSTPVPPAEVLFGNCDPPLFSIRDLDDLPDMLENPLITTSANEVKEEFHRLNMLSIHLLEAKERVDTQWLYSQTSEAMRESIEISTSIQRVKNSINYIVFYSQQRAIPVDFQELSYRYRRDMLKRCPVDN